MSTYLAVRKISSEVELLKIFQRDCAVLNARAAGLDETSASIAVPSAAVKPKRVHSAEARVKMSAAARARSPRVQSEETRRRIAAAAIRREAKRKHQRAASPSAKPGRAKPWLTSSKH